jgi:hypothetical protein
LRDIQGGRKSVTVTIQSPQQTLGTAETLPTSEPATPQISYTVADGDLPVFDVAPHSKKWVAMVVGAGKFVTAGTLSWRMKKNGASVSTSTSSISANYYYTLQAWFHDVAICNVLELALWSNKTDSNWDYKAYQVVVTRVLPKRAAPLLMPFNITSLAAHPDLTNVGNPAVFSTNGVIVYHDDTLYTEYTATQSFRSLHLGTSYGFYRLYRGDSNYLNSANCLTSSTYRPYYARQYVPVGFVFRSVKI